MKPIFGTLATSLVALLALLTLLAAGPAHAQGVSPGQTRTLHFDDLPGLRELTPGEFTGGEFPSDPALALYEGFDFSNSGGSLRWYWDIDVEPWVASSGPFSLSTYGGTGEGRPEGAAIRSSTPFTFHGAFFSGESAPVFIELIDTEGHSHRLGGFGLSLDTPATLLLQGSTAGQRFINPDAQRSLSAVVIWASPGSFAMDDFTVGPAFTASAVPEPPSLLLMLAGLGAMGLVIRHRQHRAGLPTAKDNARHDLARTPEPALSAAGHPNHRAGPAPGPAARAAAAVPGG